MPISNLKVSELTQGLLSKAVDAVLVSIFYGFEFGMGGYGGTHKAGSRAADALSEVNYESIKRALLYLKEKGLIQSIKEASLLPAITNEGKRRLAELLPKYDEKRIWDKRIYFVTYDVPKSRNKQRDRLRNSLKKIDCGMLQESVWVTPYNPKALIEEIMAKNEIEPEFVLVSSLGKDGTIGNTDLKGLMDRVYGLSSLNQRYREFLEEVKKGTLTKDQTIFAYLAILRDDPQIPFALLPTDWLGAHAYRVYLNEVKLQKSQQKPSHVRKSL